MKKYFLFLSIFIIPALLFLLSGCPAVIQSGTSSTTTKIIQPVQVGTGSTIALDEGFYILNDDSNAFIKRIISKKENVISTRCTVWTDNEINLSDADAQNIADEFDSSIYGKVTGAFDTPYDIDGDTKVAIIVYHGKSFGSYVAGYFNPGDFYTRKTYPGSNEMDVIYMNGAPASHSPTSQDFRATLAHEFQHLINYSENVIREGGSNMYTWMNEGMSENASALVYGYNTYETSFSRMSSYASSLQARNGDFSLIYWNGDIVNYSISYAFFAYLKQKYPTMYQDIYDHSGTSTTTLNTILTAKGSSLNSEFRDFVYNLYGETGFPAGFFPAGFSVPATGESNSALYPYSFIYRSAGFSGNNSDLTYLNASGTAISGSSSARMAFWTTGSSYWAYNRLSDWGNTKKQTYANASITAPLNASISAQAEEIEPIIERHDNINFEELQILD